MKILVHHKGDKKDEDENKSNNDFHPQFYSFTNPIHHGLKKTSFDINQNAFESDQFDLQFSKQSKPLKKKRLNPEIL